MALGPHFLGTVAAGKNPYQKHFSATVYTGDGIYPRRIETGVAAGDGFIWIKRLDAAGNHQQIWVDPDDSNVYWTRLINSYYPSQFNPNRQSFSPTAVAFDVSGFTLSSTLNVNNAEYVVWSFKNTPGFLDTVKYIGDETAERAIPHNLGTVPGMVWVEGSITHNGFPLPNPNVYYNSFMAGSVKASFPWHGTTNPTSTDIYVGETPSNGGLNNTGTEYFVRTFAHNPTSQGRSATGAYTGMGTGTPAQVICGWHPRLIMICGVSTGYGWRFVDTTRSPEFAGDDWVLSTSSDAQQQSSFVNLIPGGFEVIGEVSGGINNYNILGQTYAYVAIR